MGIDNGLSAVKTVLFGEAVKYILEAADSG